MLDRLEEDLLAPQMIKSNLPHEAREINGPARDAMMEQDSLTSELRLVHDSVPLIDFQRLQGAHTQPSLSLVALRTPW